VLKPNPLREVVEMTTGDPKEHIARVAAINAEMDVKRKQIEEEPDEYVKNEMKLQLAHYPRLKNNMPGRPVEVDPTLTAVSPPKERQNHG
jgi:hypothetical protein